MIYLPTAGELGMHGFELLATAQRPHFTVRHRWTFLDEARDPAQITPGALVVAGDEDAAAVCQVIDLVPAGDGTIVHLRPLPGLVDDYRALVERALAS